ncbi:hypothetical protein GCM10008919_10070 [Selenomonas dianae]|uniref:Uncharacterized protein n=1 Tax=Selenomonas dianae TaxID=135079 RepID=A0ABN0T0U7_9FIRM
MATTHVPLLGTFIITQKNAGVFKKLLRFFAKRDRMENGKENVYFRLTTILIFTQR